MQRQEACLAFCALSIFGANRASFGAKTVSDVPLAASPVAAARAPASRQLPERVPAARRRRRDAATHKLRLSPSSSIIKRHDDHNQRTATSARARVDRRLLLVKFYTFVDLHLPRGTWFCYYQSRSTCPCDPYSSSQSSDLHRGWPFSRSSCLCGNQFYGAFRIIARSTLSADVLYGVAMPPRRSWSQQGASSPVDLVKNGHHTVSTQLRVFRGVVGATPVVFRALIFFCY